VIRRETMPTREQDETPKPASNENAESAGSAESDRELEEGELDRIAGGIQRSRTRPSIIGPNG
jgi:hypothetical protein